MPLETETTVTHRFHELELEHCVGAALEELLPFAHRELRALPRRHRRCCHSEETLGGLAYVT
jgi:hypothetical protein